MCHREKPCYDAQYEHTLILKFLSGDISYEEPRELSEMLVRDEFAAEPLTTDGKEHHK